MGHLGIFEATALSADGITQILRQKGKLAENSSVKRLEYRPFGTGQSGESLRLYLSYETGTTGPASLVAKFASSSESARAFANAAGMYEREVRFYNELSSDLPVRTPEPLYAALDSETARFAIIMEDLAEARIVDQLIGNTIDEAALVMEQAAALHAGSWKKPALREATWLKSTGIVTRTLADALPGYFQDYVAAFGDKMGAEALSQAKKMVRARNRWAEIALEPYCLWHQDFRCDNMLFDAVSGSVPLAIVDWQTIGMGRGMADIAYYLGTSVSTKDRRDHERQLVEHYHRELWLRGVRDYDFDTCWLHYRENVAQGVFTVVHAAARAARTDRGDQMWMSWAKRTAAQAADLDTFSLLG